MKRRVAVPSIIGVYDRSCPISRRRVLDLFRAMSVYDRRISWIPIDALRPTGLWGYSMAVVSSSVVQRFRSFSSYQVTFAVDINDGGTDAPYVIAPGREYQTGLRSMVLSTAIPMPDILLPENDERLTVAWVDPAVSSSVADRTCSILHALRSIRPNVRILADRSLIPDVDVHIDVFNSDIDRMRAFAMADIALFVGSESHHIDLGFCEALAFGRALPVCVDLWHESFARYSVSIDGNAQQCAAEIDRILNALSSPDGLSYRKRILSGWAHVQRERLLTPMRAHATWLSLIEFYRDITSVKYVPSV